jgi:hypothetical protein
MADEINKRIQELQETINSLEAQLKAAKSADDGEKLANLQKSKLELENILRLTEQITKNRNEEIDDLQQEIELLTKSGINNKNVVEYHQKQVNLNKLLIEQLKEKEGYSDDELKALEKKLETSKKELNLARENNKEQEKHNDLLEKGKKIMDSVLGSYAQQIRSLFAIEGLGNRFASMFEDLIKANEDFVKNTGQTTLFSKDMYSDMAKFGVGATEASAAASGLYNSMSAFSYVDKNVRDGLVKNAAAMANLNVDASTLGKTFDDLTKSLKFDASQVGDITNKIAQSSLSLGIAPSKALKDFGNTLPQLSVYGKKAVDVFKDLQVQSKQLGIEVSSLMGIVGDGFDTFEGAADKAGKLNAILGGDYLNSVELLNATEGERVQMLKDAFNATGKNFDSLDKFEKKAIAASLGIKDLNEAQKLFGNISVEDRIKMEKQAAEQKNLTEAQEKAASTTRQLQLAFSQLMVIIEPVATQFKNFVIWLSGDTWGASAFKTIAIIIGIIRAIQGFSILTGITGLFSSLISKIGLFSTTAPAAASGISEIGLAATEGSIGILALGGAIALVGLGIGIAAFGMAQLAQSFAGLSGENAWAAVAVVLGLTAGIIGLGAALIGLASSAAAAGAIASIGIGPLLALSAVLLAIGGAVYLASTGTAQLIDSISKLNNSVINVSGFRTIKNLMSEITDIINEIPETVEFTAKVNNIKAIGDTLTVAARAGSSANIEPATRFVTAAKEYHVAQKESKSSDNDALINTLKTIIPSQNSAQPQQEKTRVTIYLDDTTAVNGWMKWGKPAIGH